MAGPPIGTRVIALHCSGGYRGKVVGKATVFPVRMPDGSLKSCRNPEARPPRGVVPFGGTQLCIENDIKIKLDRPLEGRDHIYGYEALILPEPTHEEVEESHPDAH